jgi:alpha-glucosidase
LCAIRTTFVSMSDWWRGAVIYQIYPRSFADSNGDGIGDLPGIIDRLSYVASLGVDGIWLSPFFPSPMKDFGYDVADHCGVDPMFGSREDFDCLVARAHDLKLKVIIDQVYSHTSDQHPWFRESRISRHGAKADWYVWADPKPDGTPPNNWLAVFGGVAWEWEPRRRQYYLHNFLKEQPDLNFHHPDVQEAILAVAEFWLRRGVDGFRLDVANFFAHDPQLRDNPPYAHPEPVKAYWMQRQLYNRTRPETLLFVARLRALLDRYPGTMALAEIASDDPIGTTLAYIDGPDRYHSAYSFVFLRQSFGAGFIRASVEALLAGSATAWPSWAFSNHDVPHAVSRWSAGGDARAFAKVLTAVLTCLRGTAFLYQGEELGLPQADVPFERLQDPEAKAFWPVYHSRDGARTPMPWRGDSPGAGFSTAEPWLPVDPRHYPLAVDLQEADPASVLRFTRRFLAWRRKRSALMSGDIMFLDTAEPVLAFLRSAPLERLLCAFNLGPKSESVRLNIHGNASPLTGTLIEPLSGYGLPGRLDGDRLDLPPYGAVFAILE